MYYTIAETSLGYIGIAATDHGLYRVTLPQPSYEQAWEHLQGKEDLPFIHDPNRLASIAQRFVDYALGEADLSDLPLDYTGLTPFQRRVSELVHDIPKGAIETYGTIAARCGSPRGSRAVGGVMASNRLCLVVPCHRVLAHDGSLGGFAGGLAQKAQLLRLEGLEIAEDLADGSRRYRVLRRR